MNPEARLFFEENPGERYWYYSANLRVPNPRHKPWLDVPRVPWGKVREDA